jgi:pilus assembly protein CpaE
MESVIKAKDAAALLEIENLFYISNDFKVVSKSFNIGIPFMISKPKERISNEINIMASKITNKKSHLRNRRRKKKSIFDVLKN